LGGQRTLAGPLLVPVHTPYLLSPIATEENSVALLFEGATPRGRAGGSAAIAHVPALTTA
jgi:hypothetical protein